MPALCLICTLLVARFFIDSMQVGGWDPITRVPMTLAEIRPNIAMRNAVHLYLEEHGWAWHECF